VAIVGLVHDHVGGFIPQLAQHPEVQLVGIAEPDPALTAKYQKRFHLDSAILYTSLEDMIAKTHPQVLLGYTATSDHRHLIEVAARHGISVMVEKPLAISLDDALAIRKLAKQHGIHVMVNYETIWYSSNQEAYNEVASGRLGELRKAIVRDGHQGPKEIHVGPEFLDWLTDPVKDGAGALYDFGCYGADLMTWLMHGETPLSVTAVTQTDKPDIYPKVDDDSTIIVRYPKMQAIIMGSWNWTFSVKNMELYGTKGQLFTDAANQVTTQFSAKVPAVTSTPPPLEGAQSSSIAYLANVIRTGVEPRGDLTALDTNVIVMQILDAARTSARTGRTIELKPLPPE
jgi:predicted dehydrogenase